MTKKQEQKYNFTLGHRIEDIARLEHIIKELAQLWDIDEKSLFQLNLILEELISNTMFYGFKDMENGRVDVELFFDGKHIHVDIHDDARAFDPTKHDHDPSGHDLDERDIGGLGLLLTRQISEDLNYRYEEGKNKLHLKINTERNAV
jgi:anti-sigma regulatory factor (Ser/Thr protein kinase)